MNRQSTILAGALLASLVLATPAAARPAAATGTAMRSVVIAAGHGDHPAMRAARLGRGHFGSHGRVVIRPGIRFYDPFWMGFGWGPYWGSYGPGYGYYAYPPAGALKLKVTGPDPKQAQVFANGDYVGTVDDFNGTFQELDLAPGSYSIQIRAPGFQPLTFGVTIQPDKTVTYRGNLQPAV